MTFLPAIWVDAIVAGNSKRAIVDASLLGISAVHVSVTERHKGLNAFADCRGLGIVDITAAAVIVMGTGVDHKWGSGGEAW